MLIRDLRVTPIAFSDPPLLNSTGVHEPWALRTIVEVETDDGRVGLSETHGGEQILTGLRRAREAAVGLSPFDLNGLRARLDRLIVAGQEAGNPIAPGTVGERVPAMIFGALEVALLDLQGQACGLPVATLLGGAVRDRVPYSAYLFYKYAEHIDDPGYPPDPWGEALTPEQLVAQARRMLDAYGFASLKLKGGVLPPDAEIATMRALAQAFPDHPLRIDPNAGWTVPTSIRVGRELDGVLEYLEDPTGGMEGMAAVARELPMPLATNMVVTAFEHLPEAVRLGAVGVVLSDHHYWGGLRASQQLAAICATWGLGLSMHSNSHLGISLAAMTHLAAAVPNLAYACDTHYPWQTDDDEVIAGGRLTFHDGALDVPDGPGLGVTLDHDRLARLHEQYQACGLTRHDMTAQMRRYDPSWTGQRPRF